MSVIVQTIGKQGFEEFNLMTELAAELEQEWLLKLETECPNTNVAVRESIVRWLLGEDTQRFDSLSPDKFAIAQQAMDYRYRILRERYLGVAPERAYRHLTTRLGSLVLLRNKIRTWVALSRDRQRAVGDVLQEVIQEMLNSDRYIQQQIAWISKCTQDTRLRNTLLFASIEEYSLRPIRNKPLLLYRFVNYLRRSQRGGMTNVPDKDLVRLVSDEVAIDEDDNRISLIDNQAVAEYQEKQDLEEQQELRTAVKTEFSSYLAEKVGPEAAQWLQLYLQGRSQEAIATAMNLPIKQIYRLREKVSYHAIQVFAVKTQSKLVGSWLKISIEDSFGLTPQQWQKLWTSLSPIGQQIVTQMKDGKNIDEIAKSSNLKASQVMGEWSKIYLAAQDLRSDS